MVRMRRVTPVIGLLILCVLAVGAAASAAPRVVSALDIETIIPKLAAVRVVYVGEEHDRADHHANELEIVRGVHARHPDMAVAMEMFTQPEQGVLDAYIAGAIDENELVRRTHFDKRWYDGMRQYGAILRFAREHRIPIVALNAPEDLVNAVKAKGIAGLDAADRARLPAIGPADGAYQERLAKVFTDHPGEHKNFQRFLDVQLLWDESMAQRLADYLRAHRARRVVVITGNGHVAFGSGVPERVRRRLKVDDRIVLQGDAFGEEPGAADYVLRTGAGVSPK
jgi:uncharacterized iron-regulated protein